MKEEDRQKRLRAKLNHILAEQYEQMKSSGQLPIIIWNCAKNRFAIIPGVWLRKIYEFERQELLKSRLNSVLLDIFYALKNAGKKPIILHNSETGRYSVIPGQ